MPFTHANISLRPNQIVLFSYIMSRFEDSSDVIRNISTRIVHRIIDGDIDIAVFRIATFERAFKVVIKFNNIKIQRHTDTDIFLCSVNIYKFRLKAISWRIKALESVSDEKVGD